MPDRRRQRQQRVRHDAGGSQNSVRDSNREPERESTQPVKPQRPAGSGVAFAEPKVYESVTIMPDKEVVEPETYHRREVLSNWSRYEELPSDEPELGEDYLLGEDFSQILEQQANSGGGHFRLKGESQWNETETGILASHGLGALHVADLVASINTVPLYTQLNIPEEVLPASVVEYYFQLAEDNRKVYQPSNNYNECSDVNDKIIESLKISDNEPLNLTTEEPETNQNIKNAVDVALSLTSAFAPEPEDVDLDTLLHEPSVENQPSPIRQLSSEKQPSPVRQPSPVKAPTPLRQPSPVKEPSPVKQMPSKANKPLNVKEVKQPTPVPKEKSNNQREKSKEKSPASFDFGLSKKESSDSKPPAEFNFGLPKVDVTAKPKSNKVTKNVKDNVDVLNSMQATEKTEDIPEGPIIDLDAPAEESKPVLLISKTEADDLEDWLDSMLDD